MARKLKTYQTSQGFFDLAIAAPSMKAALAAWGSNQNLFHSGLAKEASDPAVIAATLDKPGVVLKRPVGSNGVFKEHAELPDALPIIRPRRAKPKPKRPAKPVHAIDSEANQEAALAFGRAEERRERERLKDDATLRKTREQRSRAIDSARATLAKAQQEHESAMSRIENDRTKLDRQSQAEQLRWTKEKKRLKARLRPARG